MSIPWVLWCVRVITTLMHHKTQGTGMGATDNGVVGTFTFTNLAVLLLSPQLSLD
jgi:hypothetical protein